MFAFLPIWLLSFPASGPGKISFLQYHKELIRAFRRRNKGPDLPRADGRFPTPPMRFLCSEADAFKPFCGFKAGDREKSRDFSSCGLLGGVQIAGKEIGRIGEEDIQSNVFKDHEFFQEYLLEGFGQVMLTQAGTEPGIIPLVGGFRGQQQGGGADQREVAVRCDCERCVKHANHREADIISGAEFVADLEHLGDAGIAPGLHLVDNWSAFLVHGLKQFETFFRQKTLLAKRGHRKVIRPSNGLNRYTIQSSDQKHSEFYDKLLTAV
jgi:hypothetical protein